MKSDYLLKKAFFLTAIGGVGVKQWEPLVDVYRTPEGWLLKLDLAGVRPEDVSVTIQSNRLHIRGLRQDQTRARDYECYALEIPYSRFERSIELPEEVERMEMVLDYDDGILIVHLQRR